ncbi:HhoA/HhoB/HtrA family serine endopeptidase [Synechococcus sp. PCC 7336]|uniref:HhoA/HhoB/HtrA family serine endopeptidase n=1 Tax=Synechococcus sp. PCC 7336 TaxID=195250 RepID=UPI0012EABAFF|nr:HhoA/HhoB/HtrA family serine endopeptidase [Synechococcus sp. PCC 7336]
MTSFGMRWGRSLVTIAIAFGLLFGGASLAIAAPEPLLVSQVTLPQLNREPDTSQRNSNFVTEAVRKVGPAVVRIDTERTVVRSFRSPFDSFARDPFFQDFFGDEFFPEPRQQEFHTQGQGSGFIVDRDGIVVTNAHVVSEADTVAVKLQDGRVFDGTVRGVDEVLDLAVIKIDGRDLPVVPLGDSSTLQVGDWAIALGNPLGLDSTVTLGIVSTLNRSSAEVGIVDKRLNFIQTDAAINPGNSGGPLLNERGEVIGINTAIRANAQGIGFAIPINIEREVQARLVRGETIPHPYIGVQMVTLTPELRDRFNSDPNSGLYVGQDSGVLVVQVVPNSPAEAAGIRAGDVILRVNSNSIATASELQEAVEATSVGGTLKVEVERGDRREVLRVRTADLVASR